MAAHDRAGLPSAGLYAGPLAWLVSLQVKYALVPWVCANKLQLIHPVTLISVLIGLTGAYFSWRALATSSPEPLPDRSGGGRPHRFVAAVGVLISLLFTLVILLQGAAAFFLEGCER
jgi:hypothetical protein